MKHNPISASSKTKPLCSPSVALGVVYGDIGTSRLYAIKECFHGHHAIALTEVNIFGVMSLVFWSLTIVVSIKYVIFILFADNHGEGGIFALFGLISAGGRTVSPRLRAGLVLAGILGAEEFVAGKGVIVKWERLRRQNHWFDALYNACAAGHFAGVRLVGEAPRKKRRYSLEELANRADRPTARELAGGAER